MSATHSSPLPNKTILFTVSSETLDPVKANWQINLALFCLSFAIATVTCAGGLYSLLSVFRMRSKTSLCVIVASLSIDDLISVVPLSLFMFLQWWNDDAGQSRTICTLSGLLYVFQGLSSNMKACLIVAYTFYVTKRFGVYQTTSRPLMVLWAVAAVWLVSLIVSILPLCGWGRFVPASLGCLPESDSFYVLLLFAIYSVCFCGLLFFSVPLTYQLLCLTENKMFYPSYFEIARTLSADVSATLCEIPSQSRDSLEKSFGAYSEFDSDPGLSKSKTDTHSHSPPATDRSLKNTRNVQHSPTFFAQKRFSMILAMARIVLWMPMMTQILVSHAVRLHSSSLETLSFFLTLLSALVTPVFVLSKHWIHLPCGCFINCHQGPASGPSSGNKRRFEFNLSFQHGYGIYKISHAKSPSIMKPSYNSLYNCDFSESRVAALDRNPTGGLTMQEFRNTDMEDSSFHGQPLLEVVSQETTTVGQPAGSDNVDGYCSVSSFVPACDREDTSSVFDGQERRLSHEECRKIELSDWEWCRSKSERTPRQKSTGGLAIPLCAFQGTVSLHAPTGKTLSLSTYEVSSDGLKLSPNGKKVEVYRSKSVGHEPEEAQSGDGCGGSVGDGIISGLVVEPGGVSDTNVKIHLEVLEICDNEEAMDSVSIVSNISQSSAHARSPSLRYSRRENRFVSCDLGETASYSLLIPTSNPDTDNINIHIPDTVEAHRQNSQRQHQESTASGGEGSGYQESCASGGGGGYQEEIQLLNEAYRRQTADQDS